jgi:hypothetical protein
MTAPTRPGRWRGGKRRPVPGNSPDDRMQHGPDCHRPRRVCADSFSATPPPRLPKIHRDLGMRFIRHGGIYRSDGGIEPGAGSPPPVGRRPGPGKERDGRSALCSSSAMSSDRLFLDRGARQHCPSPLHRHGQTTMRLCHGSPKPDISTLQRIGHFYFALTASSRGKGWKRHSAGRRFESAAAEPVRYFR